jgi:hypothetical protein
MENSANRQPYDQEIEILTGGADRLNSLFIGAPINTGASYPAGGLVSLNAAGKLIAGCPAGTLGNRPMPLFAGQSSESFDANSDVGNISGGNGSAAVATGGFEIATSSYDDTVAYAPNDLLTTSSDTSVKVTKLTTDPYGVKPVVGVVSRGSTGAPVLTSPYGTKKRTFWTLFLPATTAAQG